LGYSNTGSASCARSIAPPVTSFWSSGDYRYLAFLPRLLSIVKIFLLNKLADVCVCGILVPEKLVVSMKMIPETFFQFF
jgi:hypothetical protein